MTYFLNVPIAACFTFMSFTSVWGKVFTYLIGLSLAIVATLIFSTILRDKTFDLPHRSRFIKMNLLEKQKYKSSLFKTPLICGGIVVQLQWVLGIGVLYSYYSLVEGFTANTTWTFILVFIYIAPVNFTTHAARSDSF